MYITDTITELHDGYSVQRYLLEWRRFSKHLVRRLKFRFRGIELNGEHVTVLAILHTGDQLQIHLSDVVPEDEESESRWMLPPYWMPEFRVIREDEHTLFVDKPSGLVCHPSHGHYADTLANQVAEHLGVTRGPMYPIGRLDRDTTGVVCYAKHVDAAGQMTIHQLEGTYHKYYLVEVEGVIQENGLVDSLIGVIHLDPMIIGVIPAEEGGKEAETTYRVLGHGRSIGGAEQTEIDTTYLLVTIRHGRTHQIRVHMSSIGHPIVGDPLYGNGIENHQMPWNHEEITEFIPPVDMHLHAFRAYFKEPFSVGVAPFSHVEAPRPHWFPEDLPIDPTLFVEDYES